MKKLPQFGPGLLAVLTFLVGILNIVSAIQPALPQRIHLLKGILPLLLIHGSRHLVVLAGFLLALIARGISRRKKVAWWSAFILMLVSVVFNMFKGLDYEEALAILAVMSLFILLFPHFKAGSDIPTIKRAFQLLAAVILFNIMYGVAGFYFFHQSLGIEPSLHNYLAGTLREMFSLYYTVHPQTGTARRFINSLWIMWEAGLLLFLLLLLRPVIYRRTTRQHDLERAENIARAHGKSSLVYFTLWDDKYYFFNGGGTCYIAYRQEGDVAVALGDPVGAPEDVQETILQFVEFCENNGWYPAFYQVLPDNLTLYKRAGLRNLPIGDEAVVDLRGFDMSGKRWKHLRNNMNKLARLGLEAVWRHPPLDNDIIHELKQVSDDWLYYQGGEEKAFSLGWFDPERLKNDLVVTVENEAGKILAFANFIPMYTLPQASPDMMRFSRQAPNGIMDFLFINSLLYFKEAGLTGFNLGLAPLAHVGKEESSSVAERAVRYLYENFYNFKGLYEFKSKYYPRWEPRYLIYPHLIVLPKVVLAVVKAGNPSGLNKFWRWWLIKINKRNERVDNMLLIL